MKKFCSAVAAVLVCCAAAFGQDSDYTAKLKILLKSNITEKVYLHFDKPYYATGDTIYFKTYVKISDKQKLSRLSDVLHVDLIGPANNVSRSIKLQLVNGVAWGDFPLADSLPQGNYRVRAYTKWMRNMGDDNLYEQFIPVGSLKNNKVKAATANIKKEAVDLQFFPEGGDMLEGIQGKVAFKAIKASGLGVDVKGVVTDNTGVKVADITSAHLGMGHFNLKPEAGKTYTATVTGANGLQTTVALPKAKEGGITLIVNNDSLAKIKLQVVANDNYFKQHKDQVFILNVYWGGLVAVVKAKLTNSVMPFDILKKKLPTGITRITLTLADGEPLSERLVYIQSPDMLALNIAANKTQYTKREPVNINLTASTQAGIPVDGNFSVSVTDEGKVIVDENEERSIQTNFLITADLRGYVEQPGYYFINNDARRLQDLDLLMLTQGYRRYVWQPGADSTIRYMPERNLELSGIAKTSSGKPLANGDITLIGRDGGPMLKQVTNDQGGFKFTNLVFQDTTAFVVKATNSKGKGNPRISLSKESTGPVVPAPMVGLVNDVNQLMPVYLANDKNLHAEMEKYAGLGIRLKQVNISGRIKPPYRTLSYAMAGNASQVLHMKDIKGGGTMESILSGRLRNINFINGIAYLRNSGMGGSRPMLLVVDGTILPNNIRESPISNINNFSYTDVKTIEVLSGTNALIYGMESGGGVLVITTRQGDEPGYENIEPAEGVYPVKVTGFYKAREFYTPLYNTNYAHPAADLRSTIYWKPNLVTDKEGKTSFNYFNADGTGTYRVVVEGIDSNGLIGRQVFRYSVQ